MSDESLPGVLLLARHGQTDWNRERRLQGHTDVPLNDDGRRQAECLAERLGASFEIDAIHASDLVRAAETARIVGARLGISPVLSGAWREINVGALEGTEAVEAQRRHGELISAAARCDGPLGDGAEPFRDFQARIVAAFERVGREHAGKSVLVVSHGGTLKTLIAHLIGLPSVSIDRLSLRANAGLSVVDFRQGRPQLILLNDARHLE